MDYNDACRFIKTYRDLYFTPDQPEKRKTLGICSLNCTDRNVEDIVMEDMRSGTFGETAFAWKSGKICWDDGAERIKFRPEFEHIDDCQKYYRNGYGKPVCQDAFNQYCNGLEERKTEILLKIESKSWDEAYCSALFKAPKNFGPVNIINAMFFISSGAAPIYDSFAHKAVRALAMNIAPKNVFMGANPDKTDTESVMRMYGEYMCLLKKLFPEYIYKDGSNEFIPRELDRALWVYGHSDRAWESND